MGLVLKTLYAAFATSFPTVSCRFAYFEWSPWNNAGNGKAEALLVINQMLAQVIIQRPVQIKQLWKSCKTDGVRSMHWDSQFANFTSKHFGSQLSHRLFQLSLSLQGNPLQAALAECSNPGSIKKERTHCFIWNQYSQNQNASLGAKWGPSTKQKWVSHSCIYIYIFCTLQRITDTQFFEKDSSDFAFFLMIFIG